jgi:hypothetical protein
VTPISIPDGTGVDSRQYRFSFAIPALSQVPADFVLPPDLGPFNAGVFLPRDDVDWLGRRRYPARILLLSGREALVVPHPAAGEPTIRVPLDRIERIEWGRILLTGWVVLTWDGGHVQLPYNTRARGAVEKCVRTLQDRWLPALPIHQPSSTAAFGEPLDLKFGYARSAELLTGEAPLAQFFEPAVRGTRRFFWFRRNHWPAADLVLVTPRRLLWITERNKRRYERYGTVSHSARLASIAGVRCVRTGEDGGLEIAFYSGDTWHVPVQEDREEEASRFEAAMRKIVGQVR